MLRSSPNVPNIVDYSLLEKKYVAKILSEKICRNDSIVFFSDGSNLVKKVYFPNMTKDFLQIFWSLQTAILVFRREERSQISFYRIFDAKINFLEDSPTTFKTLVFILSYKSTPQKIYVSGKTAGHGLGKLDTLLKKIRSINLWHRANHWHSKIPSIFKLYNGTVAHKSRNFNSLVYPELLVYMFEV